MGKKDGLQDLVLSPPKPGEPLFRWLYGELRRAVLEGRLSAGARLPATRSLARQYGVSRGTVVGVYEQLQAEGYVRGRVGSGTVVSDALPDEMLQAPPAAGVTRPPARALLKLSRRGAQSSGYLFALGPPRRVGAAFRAHQPALDVFPLELWSRTVARRLRRTPRIMMANGDPCGYRPLREAVAAYLGSSRGVRCSPDQVFIVAGTQQALSLTAGLLLDPGDRVWVEAPGYEGARLTLEASGAKVVGVPVDDQGLCVEVGRRRAANAKLAYVTPAHQYPLGAVMSLERRLSLLKWAKQARAAIFEDDYDSEFRYEGRPLAALQGLDQDGLVLFAGSFGKTLFPSLRLGYLVLPPPLVDAFAAARSIGDRYPPVFNQAVVCDFIVEGHFGRHLRRMREVYAERRDVFVKAMASRLGGLVTLGETRAGMQTVGWLPPELPDEKVAASAAERGLEVLPLSRLASGSGKLNGLFLGFAAVEPRTIRRGVEELAAVIDECHARR